MSAAAARPELLVITDAQDYGDDGAAILMLLKSWQQLRTLVATGGNVWPSQAQANLEAMLAATDLPAPDILCGPPLDAYAARRKLHSERHDGESVQYAGALAQPPPAASGNEDAAGYIGAAGTLVIAAMAPLTVLAAALRKQPRLPQTVTELYILGGALETAGNATPAAEFNLWFDATAAAEVLDAGFRITLVPLDCTASLQYSPATVARLAASKSLPARWVSTYLRRRGARPLLMWDEVVAGILIEPRLVLAAEELDLSVEQAPGADYGRLRRGGKHSVRMLRQVDKDGLNSLLCELLDPRVP